MPTTSRMYPTVWMLKPVVETWTAHAMIAPAAIRMRLTPRPICRPPEGSWGSARSPAARDGDELEVRPDLPEQPVQARHERRVVPLLCRRRRAEPVGPENQRLADLLELVHGFFYSLFRQAANHVQALPWELHKRLTRG